MKNKILLLLSILFIICYVNTEISAAPRGTLGDVGAKLIDERFKFGIKTGVNFPIPIHFHRSENFFRKEMQRKEIRGVTMDSKFSPGGAIFMERTFTIKKGIEELDLGMRSELGYIKMTWHEKSFFGIENVGISMHSVYLASSFILGYSGLSLYIGPGFWFTVNKNVFSTEDNKEINPEHIEEIKDSLDLFKVTIGMLLGFKYEFASSGIFIGLEEYLLFTMPKVECECSSYGVVCSGKSMIGLGFHIGYDFGRLIWK